LKAKPRLYVLPETDADVGVTEEIYDEVYQEYLTADILGEIQTFLTVTN
jgi:hypothetical protein